MVARSATEQQKQGLWMTAERPYFDRGANAKRGRGFTLLELIVAATILAILTLMLLPLARVTIQREKEKELRGWPTLASCARVGFPKANSTRFCS
jgi:prepilin-type N-terminal cleavage/methylation domain-containing protein